MSKYTSYILFLLISIFVVILYINNFGPLVGLQQTLTDMIVAMTTEDDMSSNVVLIKVDGRAQDEYGSWPWNRDRIADLLAAAASAEPKVIVADFDLGEDAYQDSAGYTGILAGQLSWMENVVLTYYIALSTYRSGKTNNPDHLFNFSLGIDNPLGLMEEDASLQVRKVYLPANKLLEKDPYLAFNYIMPDEDRILRHQPLLMNYEGYYYPSTPLMATTIYYGLRTADVLVVEQARIDIPGHGSIPITMNSSCYIRHYSPSTFRQYSAADVLAEGFDFNVLKNKVIIVAVDDPSYTESFKTPVEPTTPGYVVTASVIENLLRQNVVDVKPSGTGINLLILFLLGGLLAFILPQIQLMYRFIVLIGGLIILGNVNYFMINSFNVAPTTLFVGLELILFMFAAAILDSDFLKGDTETISAKASAATELPRSKKPKPAESTMTHEVPVREIVASANDPENLETALLSVDDDSGRVNAAPPATEHAMADHQAIDIDTTVDETSATPAGADIPSEQLQERQIDADISLDRPDATNAPEIISPQSSSNDVDTFVESGPVEQTPSTPSTGVPTIQSADQLKSLGRYQITGILGKGAMGTVYRGVDPAINRPVALKTIRLDFVSDPEEMEELKIRLHREAQAAGKLSHPNIVTIYDVGSEGHLQYIAMEYLEGRTLEDMIKKKTKFNYRIIAEIIMQICSALEYAHQQGIVHRDIKPANIMITRDYRVKVMDYGIARVESSSMTKTGIAMGTPNYMSPEQLKGLASDQRADLFSLGVVMYELLLGRRPFKGENITSLIYSILNDEPKKPSNISPQVPLLFDRIIDRALKKNPAERYQKAGEITNDLKDFVRAFAGKS